MSPDANALASETLQRPWFVMRRRKVIGISVFLGGLATLLAMFVWLPRCPVELKVVGLEPRSMVSDDGTEPLLVTLSVSNADSVAVMFDRAATFQARVGGRWLEIPRGIDLDRIEAGRNREEVLVMPAGTEACRLRLRYQSETWKSRLMAHLGPTGRTRVAKSPWLRKLVWPDQNKTMRTPPSWKEITLEAMLKGHSERQ